MLGVLLNLILGLSRVLLALGRRHDAPPVVARLDGTAASPRVAVVVMGAVVLALGLLGSVKAAWSLSAFTVLVYYAFTNWAALRLPRADRRYPRSLSWLGLTGCLALAVFVDWRYIAAGLAILLIGLLWRWAVRRLWPPGGGQARVQ
jgi:APA family basic amino acid/polyamine antiporter